MRRLAGRCSAAWSGQGRSRASEASSVLVPRLWRTHVKTIGIVGGVAWPSSIAYYRAINELVAQRMGGLHCADLVLAQTGFEQIERYQREGRWDLAGDLLAAQGNKLKAAGADFFLLA